MFYFFFLLGKMFYFKNIKEKEEENRNWNLNEI